MKVYNVRLCYQCDDFMFQMHYWAIFFPFVERLVIAALRGHVPPLENLVPPRVPPIWDLWCKILHLSLSSGAPHQTAAPPLCPPRIKSLVTPLREGRFRTKHGISRSIYKHTQSLLARHCSVVSVLHNYCFIVVCNLRKMCLTYYHKISLK